MKYLFIITIIFFPFKSSKSQLWNKLGLGFQAGVASNLPNTSFICSYFSNNNFELAAAIGHSNLQGLGIGGMINYTPFYKVDRLNFIMGLSYTSFWKQSFNDGYTDHEIANYSVNGVNYLCPSIGLRKDFKLGTTDLASIRINTSYRFSQETASLHYTSGVYSDKYVSDKNEILSHKLGINLAFILKLDFTKKEWKKDIK